MQFSSADLDALFSTGEVVVVGTDPVARGQFRVAEVEVQLEGGVLARELHPTVLVRADALPSAALHGAITVNGTAYVIRDIQRLANGQFKRLILAETLG